LGSFNFHKTRKMNVRNYKDSSKRASKKHVSFHALLFISIMIAAFLSMYPIRHQARDPSGLPTSEDDSQPHRSLNGVQPAIFHLTADPIKVPFVLHRARQVISIEQKIQKDPHVGACHKGQSLLAPIPSYVCEELHCLWSEAAQQNIDLYINPLSPLSQPTLGSNDDWASQKTCPKPRGGQRATLFGQPKVSFIVTMYNNVETTAKCILELFRTAHEVDSAEIIIINDGSTEDAYKVTRIIDLLRYYFGTVIKYHSNSEPSGYGAANSKGIEMASGKYIALINNDMFVTKGWLGSLLWTLETRPQTGIVGPLFLQDKGIVAEAGGLIWNDASGANVSRGKRLAHQFNHARVVDYISAACIIFAKETFLALGGFDARYEKGYYEDTDLAFTMTQAGLDIVYQPLAVVYHQEGSTFGTDQTSDLKRQLMKQNKAKFVEKWADKLQYHCPQEVGLMEGSHRASYPRLLWVDDIIPEPDRDSGSIRNINLMKILLSFGYAVSFKPNVVRSPAYEAFVRGIGVHVLPASSPASWKLTNGGVCAFDVVWVARRSIFNATVEAIKSQCPTTPLIYDTGMYGLLVL
jgi:GT2 family glycosyltransferase